MNEELTKFAVTDDLTGCYSRQYALTMLQLEIKRAKRYGFPLSCAMIDIGGFTTINEKHGRDFGNFVLKKSAEILKSSVREFDLVSRFGGDDFLLILPHTSKEQATTLCQRLMLTFSSHTFTKGRVSEKITISPGVASISDAGSRPTNGVIQAADRALHFAKQNNGLAVPPVAGYGAERDLSSGETEAVEWYQARLLDIFSAMKDCYVLSLEEYVRDIEEKEGLTANHHKTVSLYSVKVALKMGLPHNLVWIIRNAALLHDIGKIGIPENVLTKRGRYSADEYTIMKRHPLISWKLLSQAKLLDEELPIVLAHHERFDGKGYPDRIGGGRIPLGARIIAVADAFEAMTSTRPYRDPLDTRQAIDEIAKNTGTQFDPAAAQAFVELVSKEYRLMPNF